MKPWLQIVLITTAVGGGFMGLSLSLQELLYSSMTGPAVKAVCSLATALNAFVLVSGLILVRKPNRTAPIIAALAIQVLQISSSAFSVRFLTGAWLTIGIGDAGISFTARLGAEWLCFWSRPLPLSFSINVVPIFLLIALFNSRVATTR